MHWLHVIIWFAATGSVLDSIGNWISGAADSVKHLAEGAWKTVKSLFHFVTGVFSHVGDAWRAIYHALDAVGGSVGNVLTDVYKSLRQVILHTVPDAVNWAVRKAVAYAKKGVLLAERIAATALRKTGHFLHGLINSVASEARHLFRIVSHAVNDVAHWVGKYGNRVVNLVLHPSRLVAWILPHLLLPLLRFMIDQAKPVVRFFMRVAFKEIGTLASEIESVFVDIFL